MKRIKAKYLRTFLFIYLLQTIIFSFNLFAFYTEKHPEEYILNHWTVKHGLPQNTIKALLQSDDGFIWIGTPSGLVRFDGMNFKNYTRWDIPGLKDDHITCLYEDQDKVLWVGTENSGVCTLKDGHWKYYSTLNGLSSDRIRVISGDFQGDIWVGTDYGLNRIYNKGIRVYTEKDGLYDNTITALTIDSWNNLWIGTFRGGLAKFNGGIISVYGYQEGLKNLSIRTLFSEGKGSLWIGTLEGMYYFKMKEDIVHQVKGTSYTPVNTILGKSFDELWIGTMVAGVKQINKTTFERQPLNNELPDEFIHCAIKDDAGNIWLGTDTGGLVQLKPRRIFNLTNERGLPENATAAILKDRQGSIWIGTKNNGLYKFQPDNSYQIYNLSSGLSSNRIKVLCEDVDGNLWIGTEDEGVNVFKESRIVSKLSKNNGLSSNTIKAIVQDYRGTIWIGTENGLNSYVNGRILTYAASKDSPNHVINVLLETTSRILYAGTDEGIYQLIGNSLKPLSRKIPSKTKVVSLYEDDEQTLWIGTNGDGLLRWHDGQLDQITKENGLIDNFILSINEDNRHNLWMSSHAGVFWVKQRDLYNYFDKKNTWVHSTWYDESEGMVSRQCTGNGQSSVLKTTDSRWFYPTIMGVSIIDPDLLSNYCTLPKSHIESVMSGADTIDIDDSNLPQIAGHMLKISFTATESSAPKKIRFKYRLEGPDKKTGNVLPGDERSITFHNLSFGEYTFYLEAFNNEGKWNKQTTQFSFRVSPPFYLRPEHISIFLGISLVVSSLLIYINHNRKKRKLLDKYKTSHLESGKIDEIIKNLDELMKKDKLFLNPDLSLADLAKHLKIHYNYISRIINEHFGMSYNDFINKYRIEEVKVRLLNPHYKNKTVLEIMYETGFYSKSVFNTAFKKFSGMTPTEFRKRNI